MSGAGMYEGGAYEDGASGAGSFAVGSYAVDSRDGSVGQVMAHEGGYVQLRPPGGGREWDCPPEALGQAPAGAVLRARVREANRRGRLP